MIKYNILLSFHHEKSSSLNLYIIHQQESKIQEKATHLSNKGRHICDWKMFCSVCVRGTHFTVIEENQNESVLNVFYLYLQIFHYFINTE
jgi:hypothetical protein